ncbi:MAG TPA: TetR/AcrR family transcriptional regulator [Candidatus Binataceae bacterium]|nr:TetR/AcrR family transcriptional regulator [Candidatus Binataceae bacterium]
MRKTIAEETKRVVKLKAATRALKPEDRYDANIDLILRSAAAVFAEKSFGLASIRDIAARARISFPRIYYYLRNKEELLFLISKRAFEQLLSTAEERAAEAADAELRLRAFIRNHLEYHMTNLAEMKVLVREADSLTGRYAADIARLKRDYSRLCRRLLDQYATSLGTVLDREQARILTSLLFGAMNWFYTWYEPSRDYDQRGRIMDECFRMVAGAIGVRA